MIGRLFALALLSAALSVAPAGGPAQLIRRA